MPASPILTLLITFRDHVASLSDSSSSQSLTLRIYLPFGIFDEIVLGPHVEVVESRLPLRWKMRLSRIARTALIIPPFEILMLAWPFWIFAHAESVGYSPDFLMTDLGMRRSIADGSSVLAELLS